MAKLRIKRTTTSAAPNNTDLANAELAFAEGDQTLYYGLGTSGTNASQVIKIGGKGAYVDLASPQTVAGDTGDFTITTGTLVAALEGNATTASTLQNARTIAGVSFNGSQDISLNNNAITNGAGYITSSGSISGNAATATQATNITGTAHNGSSETVYLTFIDGQTGSQGIESHTDLSYNPSTGVLSVGEINGGTY